MRATVLTHRTELRLCSPRKVAGLELLPVMEYSVSLVPVFNQVSAMMNVKIPALLVGYPESQGFTIKLLALDDASAIDGIDWDELLS